MLEKSSIDDYLRCVSTNPFVILMFYAPGSEPCKKAIAEAEKFDSKAAGVRLFTINLDESPLLAIRYGIKEIPCYLLWRNSVVMNSAKGVATLEQLNEMATALQVGDAEIN